MNEVNSREYWEGRFATDWHDHAGPSQSAMFAHVAVRMLPDWLVADISSQRMHVVDVGCAEGEAVPLLSKRFGEGAQVTGVDFSETAIELARAKFPDYQFIVGDANDLKDQVDAVFCSNVLEHFHNPDAVLASLAGAASEHVILLIPFWEFPRHEEHFVTFDSSSLPILAGAGKVLVHFDVMDTSKWPGTLWMGYQALLVYSSSAAVARCGLKLDSIARSVSLPSLDPAGLADAGLRDAAFQRLGEIAGPAEALARLHESVVKVSERQESIGFNTYGKLGELSEGIESTQLRLGRVEGALTSATEGLGIARERERQILAALEGVAQLGRESHQGLMHAVAELGRMLTDHEQRVAREVRRLYQESQETAVMDRRNFERAVSEMEQWRHESQKAGLAERDAFGRALEQIVTERGALMEQYEMNMKRMQDKVDEGGRTEEDLRDRADRMQQDMRALESKLSQLEASLHASHVAREHAEARLREIESSRSWRITAPLRSAARALRGKADERTPSPLTRLAEASVESSVIDYSEHLKEILARYPDRPIIVFRPLVDWDLPLFQRPHHIASRLAREGFLYFYCTPNAYDGIEGFRKIEDGLYLTNQFDLVSGLYRDKIIHLYSTDNHCTLEYVQAQQQNLARVVYEYIDEIDATISGVEIPDHVWKKHKALLADPQVLCVASADKLYAEVLAVRNENTALVTNGVEYEHFSGLDRNDPPAELVDWVASGRPIVGYFGALATWFDYALVEKCARRYPDYNFLLLGWDYDGTLDKSGIRSLPNVRVIGPIPYKQLPEFARFFDVATIPFKINAVTESTSPIKLFEYMSLARPIVTTDMPECRKYRSVMIGKNHGEYIELIGEAIGRRADPDYIEVMQEEALANTWDAKAKVIASLLKIGS